MLPPQVHVAESSATSDPVGARIVVLSGEIGALITKTSRHFANREIQDALIATWQLIARANQYVDQTAPFKLAKDPAQAKRLDEVLYNLAECCRIIAVLLLPVLPGTSAKIFEQLNLSASSTQTIANLKWGELAEGHQIGQPAPLFPRKDLQKP